MIKVRVYNEESFQKAKRYFEKKGYIIASFDSTIGDFNEIDEENRPISRIVVEYSKSFKVYRKGVNKPLYQVYQGFYFMREIYLPK